MRSFTLIFFPLLFSACAITPSAVPASSSLPAGRWNGNLSWYSTVPLEGHTAREQELVYINCGEPILLWKENGGGYSRNKTKYAITGDRKTHILSFLINSGGDNPGWIESQSWALVEVPPVDMTVSWSRSVNNPLNNRSSEFRAFAQVGIGKLRKVSESCDLGG